MEQRFRGLGYVFRGWSFVAKHTELVKFCVLPVILTLVVFVGLSILFYAKYTWFVSLFWAKPEGWTIVFWWPFAVLFVFAAIIIAYVLFFVVLSILTAPFNDFLSERVEQLAYGHEPRPFSWSFLLRGLGQTVLHELAKLAIYLAWILPLLFLNFIPVIGTVAFAVTGFILTARFLAYDHLDYAMARREWTFARKRGLLKEYRALTSGFGAGVAGVLLVPVVGLLSIPMAAVGGTLLFCDLEKAGAFDGEAAPSVPAGVEVH
ncbi:MAG: EI24 domain-containing protein [Deltaproteobacteria bacterium]|nr:EI24 domain-containing protein [Deltaproteobacteria bacterium]